MGVFLFYKATLCQNPRIHEYVSVPVAHHNNNNNDGSYEAMDDVLREANERAKLSASSMPECLGGGIGAESPVWMRDYSSPNDVEPTSPQAEQMMSKWCCRAMQCLLLLIMM